MIDRIQEELRRIEENENVHIIHAIESGSRAWGFASPDSDYDVRFIYVRRTNDYLKLQKQRDVIEHMLDDELDINGWDLNKFLRLLHSSNPTVFEWTNSPIIYKTTPYFEGIKDEINEYFIMRSGLHHYMNTAISNYEGFLNKDKVKLKKYFYVLRPLLACRWIFANQTPPPMLFEELVRSQLNDEPVIANLIHEMVDQKKFTPEVGLIDPVPLLHEFIEGNIPILKEKINQLPKEDHRDWEGLNHLFLKGLGEL